MKRTTSYKLSDMTLQQIEELTTLKHMSRTELLAVAVDRMYQTEIQRMENDAMKLTQEQQEQAMNIARFVIENGRVLSKNGKPLRASIAAEVSFEASERDFDSATADAMGDYAAQNV